MQTFLKQVPIDYIDRPSGRALDDAADEAAEEGADLAEACETARLRRSARRSTAQRLDRALAAAGARVLAQLPAAADRAGRGARCNGAASRQGRRRTVQAGDAAAIELRPTPQSQAFKPEAMALARGVRGRAPARDRQARRAWWCIRRRATGAARCSTACWRCDPQAATLPRAGIVHRLDKDTSGLMVVARTRAAMDALVGADRGARGQRASTWRWRTGRGTGRAARQVDAPIGRDPRNRLRMAVVDLAAPSRQDRRAR